MAADMNWGEETVSLGGPTPLDRKVDETKPLEGPEPPTPHGSPVEEDGDWRTETVLLGSGEARRAGAGPLVGRREPPRRRPHRGVLAGVAIAILVIALISLTGGGGAPKPQPAAPTMGRGGADRRNAELEVRIHEERRTRAERKAKAAHMAREHRRLRERRARRHKAAKNNVRPAPVSEPAPEVEHEYVPEYAPEPALEAAVAPEAPAPPAASPTPPGVEFGM